MTLKEFVSKLISDVTALGFDENARVSFEVSSLGVPLDAEHDGVSQNADDDVTIDFNVR